MKSQKGVTLMSLLIYVVGFLMVAGIIGGVTTFFYSNYSFLDEKVSVSSEYNKLNLCFVEETNKKDNTVFSIYPEFLSGASSTDSTEYYILPKIETTCKSKFNVFIVFSDENFIGWKKNEKIIYYNQNVLCNNVDDFKINKEYKNGKEIISVFVKFDTKSYSTKYTF